ncbi:hypothetical protein AL050_02900 [Pseudomonas syringae pv. daphniphylli]|nr:hypothetical protein AL050_02900 [Pseudomonas syringae pv. daphniphylli]
MQEHRTLSGKDKVKAAMTVTCKLLDPWRSLLAEVRATVILHLVTEDYGTIGKLFPSADMLNCRNAMCSRIKSINGRTKLRPTLILRRV